MKYLRPALVLTAFFVALTGLAFPGAIWTIAQALFPSQANGSLVRSAKGAVQGSALLGQSFSKPEYFHPRPSAAGSGYDAANSSGTNLGPTSQKLALGVKDDPETTDADESFAGIADLAEAYRKTNGLGPSERLPADAVTRSGSGLDPHISPRNAELQHKRVAQARGMREEDVRRVVQNHTTLRTLGLFGEPRVNVLLVNRALDKMR